MALPKYKTSRANTHSRRANWKAKAAQTVTCPNCGAPTLPHMACPSCGSFRGRVYREAVRSIHTKWLPDNGIKHRNPAIDGWQGFFYYYQVIRRLHCDLFPHAIGVQHTLLA